MTVDGGATGEAARLRRQLDCAPVTIVSLDRQARITHVNEAWRRFARDNGADARTTAGIGLDYLAAASNCHDKGAIAVAEGLKELGAGRSESFASVYACHSPTAVRWFRVDARRIAADDAVVLIHTDITEHYLAKIRVRVQAQLAQALVERAPLVETCRRIIRTTCEGLDWDFAALWMPGDGERLHCADVWAKAERDTSLFDEATRRATYELGRGLPGRVWARGAPEWTTDVAADPNLRESAADAAGFKTAFAVPVGTDEVVFAVLELFSRSELTRDSALIDLLEVSGRHLGIQVMRERTQDTFRQILDAIADLVLVKGPGSKIIWANKAFRDLYGMSNEGLQGMIDAPFVEPDHTQQYVRDDAIVFSTGKPLLTEEPVTRFDGRTLRFRTQKSPIFDASGNVVMTVGVSHDITERKRLEDDLHLAARMASVGTLAAGVAHEINTPIQFVSDSVHFLRDAAHDLSVLVQELRRIQRMTAEGAPAEDVQEAIAAAEDETDLLYLSESVPKAFERCIDGLERVSTIVRSMKEFAHPAQREMATTDLNRAIQNTLTLAQNEYKYVAELETDFDELPPVTCLVGEINQVVLNLIVNAAHAISDAVKGTERKGILAVRTWLEGQHIVISIGDTGTGIPEAVAHRVFEPFFTTKEVGKGTGQGLALAWAVVKEKHGGELTFETRVGKGTTFFIRLPIAGKTSSG